MLDTDAHGGGGSLNVPKVLFLKPGRPIVTFASPLSQLECVPFHQLFSHLIVIVFFFFLKTPQDRSLIDSWKC